MTTLSIPETAQGINYYADCPMCGHRNDFGNASYADETVLCEDCDKNFHVRIES